MGGNGETPERGARRRATIRHAVRWVGGRLGRAPCRASIRRRYAITLQGTPHTIASGARPLLFSRRSPRHNASPRLSIHADWGNNRLPSGLLFVWGTIWRSPGLRQITVAASTDTHNALAWLKAFAYSLQPNSRIASRASSPPGTPI